MDGHLGFTRVICIIPNIRKICEEDRRRNGFFF
jgi:hypothetical protein